MDIDKIKIFLSVINTKNFTATADAMGYTQSAVSQSIKKLEESLNLPLLTRTKKNVVPTQAALELIPIMRELVSVEDRMVQTLYSMQGIQIGKLRIGTFASISNHLLPSIIRRFLKDYPAIKIELVDSSYWEIEEQIQSGELDLGFIIAPPTTAIDYKVLPCERYIAILPKNHPLTIKSVIPLEELIQEPFIVPSDNFRSEIGDYLAQHHLKANALFQSKDDYITIKMVHHNLGVSILPEMLLTDFKDMVEIRDIYPPIQRRLGVAVNSFKNCTPACKKFLEYLQEEIGISFQ